MPPSAQAPLSPPAPRRSGAGQQGGYAKGRARRAAIIHTAAEHFAQHGFTSVTIVELAAACEISRAGLLRYFPDKESLLQAVLEDRDRLDRDRFQPYTRTPGGLGILRGMVDLAGHNELSPVLIALFVRLSAEASDPDHPAHPYFARRYARIRQGTAHAICKARDAGHVRHDVDPDEAAVRLTALMDGLQAQWLFDRDVDMAHHVRRAILDLLTEQGRATFDTTR
ncbi:TetR/AcrR family transcriptional regulator [Streptomyces sp. ML-6]|uniref:TetR/AcrR family transcriptional regulator n=1 Tax=Streptomyces sp. ML-6 TaxID=2982693 RepID=UPI0024C08A07|nr:TetR/AcrR family transcriptional regulator [Streptomyces sp. ML-6]MDK0524343.1 TetR/AcrR family transcriptional regulator [Streptomyces sp. ML-6]